MLPKNKLISSVKTLKGKRVLLRLDLNVPIKEGVIGDTFRLEAVVPTIKLLLEKKAKIIIISHLGSDGSASLAPVVNYFSRQFKTVFFPDWDNLFHLDNLADDEIAILENVRRLRGEMENDPQTAKLLANLADIFVNDAFSVSHRAQASTVGVPAYLPSYFGPLFVREEENLAKAFKPAHPFLFILGGLKFQTKIPLLKKFVSQADNIFIGGALANSFYKKLGYEIGTSMVDSNLSGMTDFLKNKNIQLPLDVVTTQDHKEFVRLPEQVKAREMIVDDGPESIAWLREKAAAAKFILWNGPLGNFEQGFNKATLEIARAVATSAAFSVVGGGDTVASIADLKLEKEFGFISTAGGAMLDFLAEGTLPGIEAVLKSRKK